MKHLSRITVALAQAEEEPEQPDLKPSLGEFLTLTGSIFAVLAEALLLKDQASS
jgi:hypothetical protein